MEELSGPLLGEWIGTDRLAEWRRFLRSEEGVKVFQEQLESKPPKGATNGWFGADRAAEILRWTLWRIAAGVGEQSAHATELLKHAWWEWSAWGMEQLAHRVLPDEPDQDPPHKVVQLRAYVEARCLELQFYIEWMTDDLHCNNPNPIIPISDGRQVEICMEPFLFDGLDTSALVFARRDLSHLLTVPEGLILEPDVDGQKIEAWYAPDPGLPELTYMYVTLCALYADISGKWDLFRSEAGPWLPPGPAPDGYNDRNKVLIRLLETGTTDGLDLLRAAHEAILHTRDGAPAFDDACPWLFLFHRRHHQKTSAVELIRLLFGT